jgi:hypothetical protein
MILVRLASDDLKYMFVCIVSLKFSGQRPAFGDKILHHFGWPPAGLSSQGSVTDGQSGQRLRVTASREGTKRDCGVKSGTVRGTLTGRVLVVIQYRITATNHRDVSHVQWPGRTLPRTVNNPEGACEMS